MARWKATLTSLMIALVAIAAGCATQVVVPSPSLNDVPGTTSSPTAAEDVPRRTGPTDVALRVSVGGGLRYPGATMELPPRFTLYGDGRVIYLRWMGTGTETSVEIHQARLTEVQVDALLVAALTDGGLAAANGHYSGGPYADNITTTFEIHAAGIDKDVSVYGLGHEDETVHDLAIRRQMAALDARLANFGGEVAAGRAEDLGEFMPATYLVTIDPSFIPDVTSVAWPWADLEPADFGRPAPSGGSAYLSADQAKALADPIDSVSNDLVVTGPDATDYLVRVRPLLPDEAPD